MRYQRVALVAILTALTVSAAGAAEDPLAAAVSRVSTSMIRVFDSPTRVEQQQVPAHRTPTHLSPQARALWEAANAHRRP